MRVPQLAARIASPLHPSGNRAKGGAHRRTVREFALCRGAARPHCRSRASVCAVTARASRSNSGRGARALGVREDCTGGDPACARQPVPPA